MRYLPLFPLIFSLLAAPPVFGAARKLDALPKRIDEAEKIYWEQDVRIDPVNEVARDEDGYPITGTVQSFYPDGRPAWETQWVDGKLHGVTRGYHQNRRLKEETTWVNGKLHGPARWYDEKGRLLKEILYENGKDPSAPEETAPPAGEGEQDAGTEAPNDPAPDAPAAED
jgi:hypothetical protein